ncbi:anti-sigma factor [Sagittula sp. SSi028]|uniref:anti-sigma factor n=1 Tax=Sagittula sp. SSi028 TaxID=3400636 RepID=UPI003AF6C375
MTDDQQNGALPGGVEAEAAEYALGLLRRPERKAFEARMARDAELAQDVETWQTYFASLTDAMPQSAPPARVWKRIETTLHGAPKPPVWRMLLPYVLGGIGGAAFAWVVMVGGILQDGPRSNEIYAELSSAEGQLAFAVRIDPPTHTVVLDLTRGSLPDGRSLEVWLIPVGSAPVSLGLATEDGTFAVRLSDAMAARVPGAVLAVTDEPIGGSPTGAPTGTIQASGIPIPL